MTSSTRTVTYAALISLALHALGLLWVRHWTTLPDLGIEWTLPDEVEFGVYTAEPQSRPATAPPSAATLPAKTAGNSAPKTVPQEPGRKPPHDKPRSAEATARETSAKPSGMSGALANFSPAGTQLALRLDLDRLRDSALGQDAQNVLAAIPDVRLLLEGSDVVPMRDLSRLYLASPDLRRAHVVMAGRYRGDENLPQQAVDNLARARGATATWRQLRGIRVAPWYNADETARVLALVGPRMFAITREEDLGRVLAVARTLTRAKQVKAPDDSEAAQALIAMADHELLGFSVENAKSFVRGARAEQTPDRLELSVRQTSAEAVQVQAHAQFTNAEQAQTAEKFWNSLRERYADHPLVALIGLDTVLRECKLTRDGAQLDAHTTVAITQARLLLGFARDALARSVPGLAPAPTHHDVTAIQ